MTHPKHKKKTRAPGAGRPIKYPGENIQTYRRNIPREWFKKVDNYLNQLKHTRT